MYIMYCYCISHYMHYLWEKRLFCFCTSCLLGKLAYWYLIASSFLYLLVFHFGQALDPEGKGDRSCQPQWILISCVECIWKWLSSVYKGWNLQTVSITLIQINKNFRGALSYHSVIGLVLLTSTAFDFNAWNLIFFLF